MNLCNKFLIGSIFVGQITYLIFGMVYLVDYFNISYECKESYIWEYVMVSLFITAVGVISRCIYRKSNIEEYLYLLAGLSLIDFIIALWGGIELMNISCVKITNTPLWTFALVTFFIQIISSTLLFLANCLYTLYELYYHTDYTEI